MYAFHTIGEILEEYYTTNARVKDIEEKHSISISVIYKWLERYDLPTRQKARNDIDEYKKAVNSIKAYI